MRTPRALLAALLAVVTGALTALGVVLAAPSSAGGPTSVLLVNPDTGRVAALYTSDPRYQRLSDLVGASFGVSSPSPQPTASGSGGYLVGSGGINVTWLVHDVQVWRVDRILVDGAGHVSVATQQDESGGSIWDVQPVTHAPSDARALLALLDGLGLRAPGSPAAAPSSAAAPSPAPAARPVAAAGAPQAASAPGTATAALWALAGAALGAALASAALRVVPAVRARRRAQAADAEDLSPASPEAEVITSGR
jgi:hypothetical protein